ncbi:hypothetical protein IMZ48_14355 [Candidatus Bathyarchaeota archaeon]|nr:hypothetical protein [Candidatus Bathyarchaeota archaeon]
MHHYTDREMGQPRNLETWMTWWSSMEELGLRPVNNEGNWIGDSQMGKPRFMEVCFNLHPQIHMRFPLTDTCPRAVHPDQRPRFAKQQAPLDVRAWNTAPVPERMKGCGGCVWAAGTQEVTSACG